MSAGANTKEINVTPLIDVLLVLLIIFLVMMPIMVRLETVEVPPKNEEVVPLSPPVMMKINADLTVTVEDSETMSFLELPSKVSSRVRSSKQVFLDFDDGVPWSEVLHTVDLMRGFAEDPRDPDSIKVAVRVKPDAQ